MEAALQETTSGAEEASTAPAATEEGSGNPASSTAKAQQRLKVKVNGRDEEVDIDTLTRDYQKYRAGDERLRAAAEREKLQEKWLAEIQADPWKVFEDLKLNADELAEKRLMKKIEFESLSPDAKAAHQARLEAAHLKKEKELAEAKAKEWEERFGKRDFEELQSKYATELDTAIPEFFKSTGLTATPEAIASALEHMIAHVETHGEITDVKSALKAATERFSTTVKGHIQKIPIKELVTFLSDEQLDGIRGYHLDQVREQNPLRKRGDVSALPPRSSKPQARMRTDDFFKKLETRWEK